MSTSVVLSTSSVREYHSTLGVLLVGSGTLFVRHHRHQSADRLADLTRHMKQVPDTVRCWKWKRKSGVSCDRELTMHCSSQKECTEALARFLLLRAVIHGQFSHLI